MARCRLLDYVLFFFNDTATTEIYTLSLHDALPISQRRFAARHQRQRGAHALRHRKFRLDRKSTRLNSSHLRISYAVFCLKKKQNSPIEPRPARDTDATQPIQPRPPPHRRVWSVSLFPGVLIPRFMFHIFFFFFFNDTATPEIYPLPLPDALPILDENLPLRTVPIDFETPHRGLWPVCLISEEHTSELQSRRHLVCRLLLEKK